MNQELQNKIKQHVADYLKANPVYSDDRELFTDGLDMMLFGLPEKEFFEAHDFCDEYVQKLFKQGLIRGIECKPLYPGIGPEYVSTVYIEPVSLADLWDEHINVL